MGLSLLGYVLEPPRVGGSNSPYTSTPNVYIADQAAFDAHYTPGAEGVPRTEYHAFVLTDGDLPEATFCWTKNEVIQRFDHNGREQRFQTMFGDVLEVAGVLSAGPVPPDSNTQRLTVSKPLSTDTGAYPIRISVGVDSGVTFSVSLVANDGAFGSPGVGVVELSMATGNLNWNAADLATFSGQEVRFQRQTFYTLSASSGKLGVIGDVLLLNPLPALGQYPLIRIGFSQFLTPVEVPNEGAFNPNPGTGYVEWAANTGRLNFDPIDIAANVGRSIYYEGVCLAFGVSVSVLSWGSVSAPTTFGSLPPQASDVYFRIPGGNQFAQTVYVAEFSTFGKRDQVEINDGTGAVPGDIGKVRFSYIDQLLYGPEAIEAIIGDLTLERGLKLRFFRSPVDVKATDDTLKDASAFYETTGASWADPIIQSPSVSLPATPLESETIIIEVQQGTGTWEGILPRLDVATPPAGYGYILDLDTREFKYARRRVNVTTLGSASVPYGAVQLEDPLVIEIGSEFQLEDGPGLGTYTTLEVGKDVLVNYLGGLATLIVASGYSAVSGASGAFTGTTTFTDTTKDFTAALVNQRDLLLVSAGLAAGVYTVDTVGTTSLTTDLPGAAATNIAYSIHEGTGPNAPEVLADRYFRDIAALDPNTRVEKLINLGPTLNAPRLIVPPEYVDANTRFRFGSDTFSTTVTLVADDTFFTAPASMAQGVVEVALDDGEVNFSQDDVTAALDAYWSRTLVIEVDFRIQAGLGFIEFTERMLEQEEAYVTYAIINDDDEQELVEERGRFIVRKELHQGAGSAVIAFNPLGREVAAEPEPQAFRGGRPQVNGEQVAVDVGNSTFTFLPSDQVTDALPSGAPVDPIERVYCDYNIFGAIGGEKSLTVLQPPMVGVNINIEEDETSFTIAGDRTADFKANYLLRVDKSEVYLMSGSTYDAGAGLTTVSLVAPQTFRSDLLNPALAVTSGQTRVSSFFLYPSYFVTDSGWDTTPRGGNRLRLSGDRTRTYTGGTVIHWTDGSSVFDFNIVEGSSFDEDSNKTVVVLASNGTRQYTAGAVTLKRSIRAILPSPVATVSTDRSPDLDEGVTVFRRIEGSIGQILTDPDDYTIDGAGNVTFSEPLQPSEELVIIYKGSDTIADGRNFRSTYTHIVAPTESNGLVGQILKADFTTYIPDSYYFRIETFTNFRGELSQQYENDAKAAVPSGGPVLENASQPKLYEQGRESVFYPEGRLANEDLVARPTLKYFNDAVNYLEDCLQHMDGRVVGDHNGRFLFDGLITNPERPDFSAVTNQIDDILKVAEPPLQFTLVPFTFSWVGTYQEVYKRANFSRFYTTYRSTYGVVVADPSTVQTGDTILDTRFTEHRSVRGIARRLPWAIVRSPSAAGATTLYLDSAAREEDLSRPEIPDPTVYKSTIVIQDRDGTWLVPNGVPPNFGPALDVAAVNPAPNPRITTSAPLPVDIPVGATVFHIPAYDPIFSPSPVPPFVPGNIPFLKSYRAGFDVGADLKGGTLVYIKPFPPFDGSLSPSPIPSELAIVPPVQEELLDVFSYMSSSSTSPYRAPVFDGGTEDDDGNRSFPMLTPSPESELGLSKTTNGAANPDIGKSSAEVSAIANVQLNTTAPFVGTGDLDGTGTRITNSGGAWPAPAPKLYDLVTINDGVNGPSTYRRITAIDPAGPGTIDLTPGFTTDTGFSFTITTSSSLVQTPTGTVGPAFTQLTDPAGNYLVNQVKVGHTVVFETGPIAGDRRQVTNVVSGTQLDIESTNAIGGPWNYRVDDSVPTFGGTGSLLEDIPPALDSQLDVLINNLPPGPYNERDALELFLAHVLTDIIAPTPTNGSTGAASPTLEDLTIDFTDPTYGITVSDFIYIESGTNAGFYQIEEVAPLGNINQINVDSATPFPSTASGLTYRVVSALGVGIVTLTAVFDALANVTSTVSAINTFKALITTQEAVVLDAGAFATRTTNTDLNNRLGATINRKTQLTDPSGDIANIESAMATGDRLYDARFTWIDTRINQENGILPKKDRAVDQRLKQQAEILKQLTKLLTTKVT